MVYEEQADQIAALLQDRLGIRGKGLAAKLRRAGRLLPRHVRRQAEVLVQAVQMQASPKMARMVDGEAAQKAYQDCENYLSGIDAWDRRKGRIIGILSTSALNLLAVAALVVVVLVWRGFL
jgi:hypothetical protein